MDTDYTQGSWKIEQPLPPDLLWRLRNPKLAVYPAHGSGLVSLATPENLADMKESADEIERLRELAEVRVEINVGQEKEIERLRAQIAESLEISADFDADDQDRTIVRSYAEAVAKMRFILIAALNQQSTNTEK